MSQKSDDLGDRPLIIADDDYTFNLDTQLDNAMFLITVNHISGLYSSRHDEQNVPNIDYDVHVVGEGEFFLH